MYPAAGAVKLPRFETEFGVGNPGPLGKGSSGLGGFNLHLGAQDFRAVFERQGLHSLQRKVQMPHRDAGWAAQGRLRRAVHQNVKLRLFFDPFSFDVAARLEDPCRLGFRHQHIGLGTGAGFVLEAAGFHGLPEQCLILVIQIQLRMRIRQAVPGRPRAGCQVQFAPAHFGQCSLRFCCRGAATPAVFAGQRHLLSHHPLRVRKRVEPRRARPFDIHANAGVLPRAGLGNPRFHRHPVRAGGFERRVIAERLAHDPLDRKFVGWLTGLVRALGGKSASGHGDEQRSEGAQWRQNGRKRQHSMR